MRQHDRHTHVYRYARRTHRIATYKYITHTHTHTHTHRIAASVANALECAQILDEKLGGGRVDTLCTGSLYLVGDVLLHACRNDVGDVLNL
jgi:folylpolyglutamate synthase/dihydropteroate synthase